MYLSNLQLCICHICKHVFVIFANMFALEEDIKGWVECKAEQLGAQMQPRWLSLVPQSTPLYYSANVPSFVVLSTRRSRVLECRFYNSLVLEHDWCKCSLADCLLSHNRRLCNRVEYPLWSRRRNIYRERTQCIDASASFPLHCFLHCSEPCWEHQSPLQNKITVGSRHPCVICTLFQSTLHSTVWKCSACALAPFFIKSCPTIAYIALLPWANILSSQQHSVSS